MAPFKLDNILIIYPRSNSTLVQFGLNDETFTVPEYEIRTKIYRSMDEPDKYYSNEVDGTVVVEPLKNGSIVDLEAFLQYIKLIYQSIISTVRKNIAAANAANSELNLLEPDLVNIPVLIITHHTWNRLQLEKLTQFCFEKAKLLNLLFLQSSLATTYAFASQPNSIVIDIGQDHTDIIPIIEYVPLNYLSSTLKIGGNYINQILNKLLPNWDPIDIELLKKSNIFEVVNDSMKELLKITNNDNSNLEEDGALNVMDIVTSGRDTREILEERERMKKEKTKNVPNIDREFNTFINSKGVEVTIGKERFQGCDKLIEKISKRIGLVMSQVSDITHARLAWDNVIVVGATGSITGFKEALLAQLIKDHLIIEPEFEKQRREKEIIDSLPAYKRNKNKFMDTTTNSAVEYMQVPTIIKLAKYPDYFPNWKKNRFAEITFLGGQVVSKQVFTHTRETLYITKENYDEMGPSCIWEMDF